MNIQQQVQAVYQSSSGWRKRFDAYGVSPAEIETKEDLRRLPVLQKEDLPALQKEAIPFANLTAVSLKDIARVFMSPGPIYEPQGMEEDYWGFAEALQGARFKTGDLVLNTFSYHLSPAGFMFDSALRKLGCTVIPAGVGNIELQLEMMQELPISGYVGTPSYLIKLLSEAEQRGYTHIAPAKAFFTAEKITPQMEVYFVQKQIHFTEGYGTAELGCIAYSAAGKEGLQVHSGMIVDICDPHTGQPVVAGEMGEIVVTRFHETYPLLRFGTGDLSCWEEEGKSLRGIFGRTNDMVKVKGMFVHYKQLEALLREREDVAYFQVVITNEKLQDVLTIYAEPNGLLDEHALRAAVQEVIRIRPRIAAVSKGTINREEKQWIDKREGLYMKA
ncbi:MAG: phenylacetate--CoA ligase family protein [Ectobacillus sp.]